MFGVMLMGMVAIVTSSCVQGDLYDDFYDEYGEFSPRNKKSKDGSPTQPDPYIKQISSDAITPGHGGCSRRVLIALGVQSYELAYYLQGIVDKTISGYSWSDRREIKERYCEGSKVKTNKIESSFNQFSKYGIPALRYYQYTVTPRTSVTDLKKGDVVVTKPASGGSTGHVMFATSDMYQNQHQQNFFQGDGWEWGMDWIIAVYSIH